MSKSNFAKHCHQINEIKKLNTIVLFLGQIINLSSRSYWSKAILQITTHFSKTFYLLFDILNLLKVY